MNSRIIVGRVGDRRGVEILAGRELAHHRLVDQQDPVEHAVLAHEILRRRDPFLSFTLMVIRLLGHALWLLCKSAACEDCGRGEAAGERQSRGRDQLSPRFIEFILHVGPPSHKTHVMMPSVSTVQAWSAMHQETTARRLRSEGKVIQAAW